MRGLGFTGFRDKRFRVQGPGCRVRSPFTPTGFRFRV